jgi:hypothetical protein
MNVLLPWWAKWAALGVVLLLLLLGYGIWHHSVYQSGYDAGEANVKTEWDAANTKALADEKMRKKAAEGQIAPLQETAQPKLDASKVRTVTVVKTVEKIVYANPQFAAAARPDDLGRVRRTQLAAIAAAAGGYTPAPSGSAAAPAGSGP